MLGNLYNILVFNIYTLKFMVEFIAVYTDNIVMMRLENNGTWFWLQFL